MELDFVIELLVASEIYKVDDLLFECQKHLAREMDTAEM